MVAKSEFNQCFFVIVCLFVFTDCLLPYWPLTHLLPVCKSRGSSINVG